MVSLLRGSLSPSVPRILGTLIWRTTRLVKNHASNGAYHFCWFSKNGRHITHTNKVQQRIGIATVNMMEIKVISVSISIALIIIQLMLIVAVVMVRTGPIVMFVISRGCG